MADSMDWEARGFIRRLSAWVLVLAFVSSLPPPAAGQASPRAADTPPDRFMTGRELQEAILREHRAQAPTAQTLSLPSTGVPGSVPPGFRVQLSLPGHLGPEILLEVVSLGPGGLPIDSAGDPALLPGLPPPAFTGTDGLVLRRLADQPFEEGYQVYLSDPVVLVADLRASRAYSRTAAEAAVCVRCDAVAAGMPTDSRELLSGHTVVVRFPPELQVALSGLYSAAMLEQAAMVVESVPWEPSPALRQEPARNPSLGSREVAPGTLLHSGEFTHTVTDLAVRGRGIDIAFTRTYRSGTVGSGPLGPGWELGYRVRLRALPNGDVEYYDGAGRRELFTWETDRYRSPPGVFAELSKHSAGWTLIDAHRTLHRFDRWGRRVAVADAVKDSAETGNEITFSYDLAGRLGGVLDDLGRPYSLSYDGSGRLTSIADFSGRTVTYGYDGQGRLVQVSTPAVTVGETVSPSGFAVEYAYATLPSGDLATALSTRDNLLELRDARGTSWLEVTYTDADGDGRADEVTGQEWGADALAIAYDFTARTATVTDRRGNSWVYEHDPAGHATRVTDPAGATWQTAYDAEGLVTLETAPLGRTTEYAYDTSGERRSRGNLLSMNEAADARGANGSSGSLTTTFAYEARTNQPTRITDPRGAVTAIDRAPSGLPTRITRAQGAPEESVTQLAYNDYGQATRITNPNGHLTEYRYATSGPSRGYLEREIVDPAALALTTRYETDDLGRVTAVVDPRGARHETLYNELGWVVEEVAAATGTTDGSAAPALGYRTTYRHDVAGNVIERHDPVGDGTDHALTVYTYGQLSELLTTTHTVQPGGQVVETVREYDPAYGLARLTDPVGTVTEWVRDGRGLPTSITDGVGTAEASTESFAYDLEGQRVTRTDARGFDWTSEYDGYGQPATSIDPLGRRAETSYGDDGFPVERRRLGAGAELLARSGSAYDLLGRQTESKRWLWTGSDPSGARALVTAFDYDPAGNLLTVTDPLARVTARTYDAAERLVAVTDPAGNETALTLDAAGNPTRVVATEQSPTGPVAVPMDFGYDALGRTLWSEDALGNRAQTLYDARSNPTLSVDPASYVTERVFDSLGRMVTETRPEGIEVTRGCDPAGRLTSYRDALGNTTTYRYDALGRQSSVTYPDSTVEIYAYDPAGNVTSITQPTGSVVTLSYDDAGRRVGRAMAPGTSVVGAVAETYALDGLDRLTQAVSGPVSVSRSFDSLSRLTGETIAGRAVSYTHDDTGAVAGIGYPSGHAVALTLDPLSRPAAIASGATPAATYSYRGTGRVAGKTLGAGVLSGTTLFDPFGRAIDRELTHPGGASVFGERLAWSRRSLRTAQSRTDRNGQGLAVAYDGAGRVVAAAELADPAAAFPNNSAASAVTLATAPETFTFAYDPAQNLLARTTSDEGVPVTTSMPLDPSGRNRPGSVGGVALTWDPNGNLATKGDLRFSYDERNRLTRVTDPGGTEIARYEYDAFNRRVRTVTQGTTEETAWAGWQAVEVYRDGSLHQRRTWGVGLDEAVRLEVDLDGDGSLETEHLPVYDSMGNLVVLTDGAGKPVERYEYAPFGGRRIFADLTPPEVEQVRLVGSEIWLEISEAVSGEALAQALAAGTMTLVETAGGTVLELAVDQPITAGAQAGRRIVLSPTVAPTPGAEVTLTVPAEALVDAFLNQPATVFTQTFPWPAADTVIFDDEVPELHHVLVRNGHLEIQLSEEVDLAAAGTEIQVDGTSIAWALQPDRYTLVSQTPLAPGGHSLTFGTGGLDLAGQGLGAAFSVTVNPSAVSSTSFVFQQPDPREVATSTAGNALGFHGLAVDDETGLIYVRNRYFDPELSRFLTPDPMGYVDGPNPYHYALNDPLNLSDPMGLRTDEDDEDGCFDSLVAAWDCVTEPFVRLRESAVRWAEHHDEGAGARKDPADSGLERVAEQARLTGALAESSFDAGMRISDVSGAGGLVTIVFRSGGRIISKQVARHWIPEYLEQGWELVDDDVARSLIRGPGGRLVIEAGEFSASEIRSAEHLASLGRNVRLRQPAGIRAAGGTSDLLVDGVRYDVYTPSSANPNRIIGEIARKGSQVQGGGVVLDLSQTSVTAADLGDVLSRVQGITNQISDVIILPP